MVVHDASRTPQVKILNLVKPLHMNKIFYLKDCVGPMPMDGQSLYQAARCGDTEATRRALEAKVDPNHQDKVVPHLRGLCLKRERNVKPSNTRLAAI